MKVLVIDSKIAGISGDMLISSLLDLTGSPDILDPLVEAINRLECCNEFSTDLETVDAKGVSAKKLRIRLDEERQQSASKLRENLCEVTESLPLSDEALTKVDQVIGDLTAADSKLHRSDFHLHEVASIDTIFDVVGSILLLDYAGFLEGAIYATPPPLGGGYTRMAGCGCEIAAPAPATIEILCKHRVPCSSSPSDIELTTPTGASLLANIADEIIDPYPAMTPINVGYGAGTRKIDGRPNILRVVEGENFRAVQERIIMLETNVDDISGEVVGYTIQKLMKDGAVDVFVTPAMGKKNRPVNVISVITDRGDYRRHLKTLMKETGSLGVRVSEVPRLVADRSKEPLRLNVFGKYFDVRVKTSTIDGEVLTQKPEYEDLKRIADEMKLPLRRIAEAVEIELSRIKKET